MPRLWRLARRLAREVVLLEIAIYRCLGRWIARRPDVPAGATAIGYSRLAVPMVWLWIFASATEVVVIELILRTVDAGWAEAIRLPLLVVGVWGLLWMLGLLAAYRVRPHLLLDDRLRIRVGPRVWADVPYVAIESCQSADRDLPSSIRTMYGEDDLLLIGVSGRTNLQLTLAAPTALATLRGERTVSHVGLWADEPREVARLLQGRAAGRLSGPG